MLCQSKLGTQDGLIGKCIDQFEKSCNETNMQSTNDGGGPWASKQRFGGSP